ncbi:S4 domain-containing protein YaaA [Melissococcus plutonius]|uniref:S4 domain-containing protein YaaA n=1 Tax=Melissococcus plutonius TaxID=33970 RepID=UPI003C2B001A
MKKEGYKLKRNITLNNDYMTLGQILKEITIINSGGQAKWYLAENSVFVNGELENRRGRKLYVGTMIEIPEEGTFFMVKKGTETADEAE